MNELNDRLKPALQWCTRRSKSRLNAILAKGGVGVSPIESHHIYTLHPVPRSIHKEKLKENPYIPSDYKDEVEKDAKEFAEDPDKYIRDRFFCEIPKKP